MNEASDERYEVEDLERDLVDFARQRDWERFHTPRSLLLALVGEVGELTEIFQWLDDAEAAGITRTSQRVAVEDEIADVFIYLTRLAQVLKIDLLKVARTKMIKNAQKYPPH